MDLSHLNLGMLGLVGAGLLASFWIVFKIAWKVVKIGFFIMSFCIGFSVCAALSTFTGHPQPIWALGGEALVFAWGFSLVRSKVAKVITGIAIVAMAQLVGKFGFDVNKFKDISQMPGAIEQSFLGQRAPVKQSAEHPKGSLSAAQKLAAQKAAHQKALKAKAAKAKAAREKAAKEKAAREEAAKAKAA